MTYLFDSMFLPSRLQHSSPFRLIPKPPCCGEGKPACSGGCQQACGLVGLICLSTLGCCTPEFRVSVAGRWLQPSHGGHVPGARGICRPDSRPGDLSCRGKSNHAATALGYYFSTLGCVRISSCRGQSWNCHSKRFTRLHRINQVVIALGLSWEFLFGTKGVHSPQHACSRYS